MRLRELFAAQGARFFRVGRRQNSLRTGSSSDPSLPVAFTIYLLRIRKPVSLIVNEKDYMVPSKSHCHHALDFARLETALKEEHEKRFKRGGESEREYSVGPPSIFDAEAAD